MLFSLINNLEKVGVILASASPRRYELLKMLGLEFRVEVPQVQENNHTFAQPEELCLHNALIKGEQVAQAYPDHLVISADTIVVYQDHILGKPLSEEDAFRMLSLLSGKTHTVYTSFALFLHKYDKKSHQTVATSVTFRDLTEEEIWAYVNTGEPLDKAGAYGIQGQGAFLIKSIEGCFYNVVGFPVSSFYCALDKFLKPFAW